MNICQSYAICLRFIPPLQMTLKQYQYLCYLSKTHLVNVSSSLPCGTTNKDSLMAKMIICVDSDRSHYPIRNGYILCWPHSLHHASCVHNFIFDPAWILCRAKLWLLQFKTGPDHFFTQRRVRNCIVAPCPPIAASSIVIEVSTCSTCQDL